MRLTENRTITRRAPQRSPGDRPCRGSGLGAGGGAGRYECASGGRPESNRFEVGDTARAGKRRARGSPRCPWRLRLLSSGPPFSHLENAASAGGETETPPPRPRSGRHLLGLGPAPSRATCPGRPELQGWRRGPLSKSFPFSVPQFPPGENASLPLAILPPALWGVSFEKPHLSGQESKAKAASTRPLPGALPAGGWPSTGGSPFGLALPPAQPLAPARPAGAGGEGNLGPRPPDLPYLTPVSGELSKPPYGERNKMCCSEVTMSSLCLFRSRRAPRCPAPRQLQLLTGGQARRDPSRFCPPPCLRPQKSQRDRCWGHAPGTDTISLALASCPDPLPPARSWAPGEGRPDPRPLLRLLPALAASESGLAGDLCDNFHTRKLLVSFVARS